MAGKPKSLTDQLRELIDGAGVSRYRICKDIGMTESTMSRFNLKMLDKLAQYLELALVRRETTGRRRQPSRC